MRVSRRVVTIGAGVLAFVISVGLVQAQVQSPPPPSAGPWMGLWKYNAEKSAAANKRPAPTGPQATRLFRMVPVRKDAFKYTIESVPAGGGPPRVNAELIGRFDGQDYIEIGNAGADTNRFRIVDSHTYELVDTKDGKDVMTITVTISPDGKTRTSKNSAGNISIYERVE